jgi:hypothetical protein
MALNLVVAAIVLWNTVYLNHALQRLQKEGSDSGLGFLRKFGADLTGLLRLNCGSCS